MLMQQEFSREKKCCGQIACNKRYFAKQQAPAHPHHNPDKTTSRDCLYRRKIAVKKYLQALLRRTPILKRLPNRRRQFLARLLAPLGVRNLQFGGLLDEEEAGVHHLLAGVGGGGGGVRALGEVASSFERGGNGRGAGQNDLYAFQETLTLLETFTKRSAMNRRSCLTPFSSMHTPEQTAL